MAGFLQSLGFPLVDAGNRPYDSQQLKSSDVIALYFSAEWCPPCKQFTPLLKKFVETLQGVGDQSLKVIFVSRDRSDMDMWKYMHESHGNWLAIPYAGDAREKLAQRYSVQGIPALVVLNQIGQPAMAAHHAIGQVAGSASISTQVLTTYMGWRTAAGAVAASPPGQGQERCSELPPGARVQVRGLTGAPEHNGTEGTIRGYDASKKRYTVELAEKSLALRSANLLQLLDLRVCVAAEDEDLCDAVLADVDEETGELVVQPQRDGAEPTRVRLQDGQRVLLKSGARVVVQGLQSESAKQWNEQIGKVVEFDETVGRYLVEVAPGTQLKIKPDNFRVWPFC